jgi:hypothetical protein
MAILWSTCATHFREFSSSLWVCRQLLVTNRASRPQLRGEAEVDYLIDRYCAASYTTYSLYTFVMWYLTATGQ